MTKFLLRALFILIPFLYSIYLSAQPKKERDCSTTCFSSEVVSVQKISDACASYELKVSFSGDCAHALSHFTIGVPCGEIENVWNSQNWAQVVGTDPTTGLTGFKIDDISNFGEGSLAYFTVKFDICSADGSCASQMSCWQPKVAYKASTCVNYETLAVSCRTLKASLEKEDASCFGAKDGSLSVIIEDGQAPYTYLWSDNSTGESLTDLSTGTYSVRIKDASGAELTLEETIRQGEKILIFGTTSPASCNGLADGSIDLTVSGGEGDYTFMWSNGETTEDLANINAGLYTVTVIDNAGCSEEKSFSLKDNNTLMLKAIATPTSCTEDASGTIDLTVTGGTPPYAYAWSNGESSEDLSNLTSGRYTVIVKDSKGCSVTSGFTVSKTTFQVARVVVQPTCHDDSNGSITLQEPIGGTAPFTYAWSNGQTGTALTDLSAGIYSVTVIDATGCSRILTSSINNPAEVFASATVSNQECDSEGLFSVDLTVSGGTAPYSINWSNGSTDEDLEELQSGTYTAVVADAHGCTISKEVVVEGQGTAWSCIIDAPAALPACGSGNNILSTSITDADSYSWTVESTDGSWSISNASTHSVLFTAGTENSSATFTLLVEKDGCTKNCTYTISACTGEEDPGGEDPGGEDPGEEEPGNGEGGSQTCEECFNTVATLINASGSCFTYEMNVNTTGLCRHELSHWTLAIPCGTVSGYSNSEGWKMEFGKDPTTGLYGLKVDDINSFGKDADSFAVRFTVCENNDCDLSSWNPTVAYKAGQCVGIETLPTSGGSTSFSSVSAYPNPFNESIHFEWNAAQDNVNLEIIDQYGNTLSRSTKPTGRREAYYITMETSGLPKGMYYYRMTIEGKVYNGKISKK